MVNFMFLKEVFNNFMHSCLGLKQYFKIMWYIVRFCEPEQLL